MSYNWKFITLLSLTGVDRFRNDLWDNFEDCVDWFQDSVIFFFVIHFVREYVNRFLEHFLSGECSYYTSYG